jgi:hypothetical protein
MDPVMAIDCDRGTINWRARDDTATITHADGRTETIANPDPSRIHALPFEQVAAVVAGKAPAPFCGLTEAGPHVLAINLALESSGGIRQISGEYRYARTGDDGTPLIGVVGMAELLKSVQGKGGMFSDRGVPWATPADNVEADGYERFPSDALAAVL